ncbi:MAG: biotin/lipoyl-binding protein, partial [Akkermansiaceae bacterium]|nr:biotin/lipoyl-binding protein [Armatimonadota bacterium]
TVLSMTAQTSETLVTSTLVGIFRAVSKAPVNVGSRIAVGQTIGMIEVMRLSDEITAPVSGEVSAIFVQDGQPVEYGQALFEIIADVVEEGQEIDA